MTNWIEIFENLDIEEVTNTKAHKTTTIEDKKKYFNSATYSLTVQYLRNLKKEIYLLPSNSKLKYINSLNIVPPSKVTTENTLFNQTVFEAACNYHEFISEYIIYLSMQMESNKKSSNLIIPMKVADGVIETLSEEKLTEYDCPKEVIKGSEIEIECMFNRLLNWNEYECFWANSKGQFWASNIENKVYSGKEALRKKYFKSSNIAFPIEDLDLVPEYYQLKCSQYLVKQKECAGITFIEEAEKEKFRLNEILITQNGIAENSKYPTHSKLFSELINKQNLYLTWLNHFDSSKSVEYRSGETPFYDNTVIKPKKQKTYAAKWYALLYWIELNANALSIPIDTEGSFIKSELEKIGREKTAGTGQSFYKEFTKIDVNNLSILNGQFGAGWKDVIIELSNNDSKIIEYLKKKYT